PIVPAERRRQRQKQQRHHDLDRAIACHRGRIVLGRGGIVDDDLYVGLGHLSQQVGGFFTSPRPCRERRLLGNKSGLCHQGFVQRVILLEELDHVLAG